MAKSNFWSEFKDFAMKGNVIDMAVGVVIGGAFGKIVTSPIFPWSSCGMTQATLLSVPTLAYAPFCFFNIISPMMSIFVAIIGYKIFRKESTTSPS